jgi:hypothetical protein
MIGSLVTSAVADCLSYDKENGPTRFGTCAWLREKVTYLQDPIPERTRKKARKVGR